MTTTARLHPVAAIRATFASTTTAAGTTTTSRCFGTSMLDTAHATLLRGDLRGGMEQLVSGLTVMRGALDADAWRAFATETCVRHPISALLHQDPFTKRCFDRPRGYAGDAGTLDLIYRDVALPAGTSPFGAALYEYAVEAPACRAVRKRRDLLTWYIDRTARRVERPRIFSVACGHLRELDRSAAAADGRFGVFGALDQDGESMDFVRRHHAARGVTPMPGSVADVVAGRIRLDGLDLAYSAGLYDYLPLPIARRLTARLFAMLAPRGRLLIANFCPQLRDAAYMESFMNWPLIYREESDMAAIADALPAGEIASRRIVRDAAGDVVYLEVERV
jgi:extracellular factor (EF) 3-hydroxypalmitic acid methyl ester biosynthesis protein